MKGSRMFSHNFMICDKLTNHPVQIIQARCLSEADIDLMRSEISYCKVRRIDKRDFYNVKMIMKGKGGRGLEENMEISLYPDRGENEITQKP